MSYSRKSTTCTGRISGQPLTEYDTEADAHQGADHVRYSYGQDLVPYHCPCCGKFHLAPADRHTPNTTCGYCRDSSGRAKQAYRSERDADRRAEILAAEKGVYLRVYECPSGEGWHLTHL